MVFGTQVDPGRSLELHLDRLHHHRPVSYTHLAFSNAADVQLAVVEQRQPTASPLLHLRATLRSLPPLRNLFPVDDQFESFSDARTLESRQYEFHLNELGETENRVAHLATVAGARAAHLPGVIVPAGTQDPLGVLYSMRAVD